jgi:cobalamin biosynthesis protein CobT
MSATSRVAGAVAAGYVLGRFKKLRLAVLVASAMASPKFRSAAVGLIQDRIPGGAIVGGLTREAGGRLLDAGKAAATTVVASRIDTLSQSLADRSESLRKATPGAQAGKSRADQPTDDRASAEAPADEYEEPEGEEAEAPADEYEEREGEEAEEPADEYQEPEDEEAEEPTDEYEPEEPVVRSPRRRRSASPAGRR